jgi:diaminopimelate epimerase
MLVETISGIRKIELHGIGSQVANIKVGMGEPKFRASDIPVVIEQGKDLVDIKSMLSYPVTVEDADLLLNFVSMGSPHAVYFWQRPVSDFPLSRLGPKVEHLSIFPDRVNFEVARVVSRKQIEARVWERGVGETLACGSGACAITVAAQLYGYIDNKVDIKLPGGILGVEWDGAGEVFLSGPAEIVFNGEWPDENVETG